MLVSQQTLFVTAATGTFTAFWILFLRTAQIQAGGRAEIYTEGCVRCSGEADEPDMFQAAEKKEKLCDAPHKYRRAERPLQTPLDVPELRTPLLNPTTMEFKYGDPQGPQLREMKPSCFLLGLQSRVRSELLRGSTVRTFGPEGSSSPLLSRPPRTSLQENANTP